VNAQTLVKGLSPGLTEEIGAEVHSINTSLLQERIDKNADLLDNTIAADVPKAVLIGFMRRLYTP
jgi:hypothetical protein